MDNVNFKARYVERYSVKALSKHTGKYFKKKAKIVEINKQSQYDFKALQKLSRLWASEDNFIDTILTKIVSSRKAKTSAKNQLYVLTYQNKNYRNLDAKKILGIAEVTTLGNSVCFDYLQSRPDSMYAKEHRKFEKIGDTLIKFVIKKFGMKKLYLHTMDNLIEFYKQYGFELAQGNLVNPLMKYRP